PIPDPKSLRAVQDVPYRPGEIIVKFRPQIKRATVARLHVENQALAAKPLRLIQAELVTLPKDLSVRDAVAAYNARPEVAYAEPNYRVHAIAMPDDPSFPLLWGLHNTGQSGGTPDADVDGPETWELETGDESVRIGVIDTGIDYNHPDLAANMWTNPGEIPGNEIDDDGNGYVDDVHGWDFCNDDNDPMDDHFHGTHCAGTIAATGNNGIGVVGVNWTAKLVALKFLDSQGGGWTTDAIEAVEYATMMGIRVTSNSWGGGAYSQAMCDAIEAAGAAGALFVAAAGNEGTNNDVAPHYPSSYNLPNVISVAATDDEDGLAGFSCYGATSVDLGAPGVSIYSTMPGNTYGYLNGTSMATPHVSGVVGLCLARSPYSSTSEIKAAILSGTDPVASLAGNTVTGGRLNAVDALNELTPPWLSEAPTSGTVAPHGSAEVVVKARAAGLVADSTYTARILVSSNDPDEPVVTVPVELYVSEQVTFGLSGRIGYYGDESAAVDSARIMLSGGRSDSTSTDEDGGYLLAHLS
ncbi:MAG: S8 family serine peptidase, partial [Candidatus Latescibacteria bacterium]|nr:S8 family serine peptidase [Candidatus Latescibacterota bacterium]